MKREPDRATDPKERKTRCTTVWREAGQGGFEIRTFIAVAGATQGAPIPIFAVGCTVCGDEAESRYPIAAS